MVAYNRWAIRACKPLIIEGNEYQSGNYLRTATGRVKTWLSPEAAVRYAIELYGPKWSECLWVLYFE